MHSGSAVQNFLASLFQTIRCKTSQGKKSYPFVREIALRAYLIGVDGEKRKRLNRKRIFLTPKERAEREDTIETSTKYS